MLIVAGAGRLNCEIGLIKSGVVGLVFALASIFPFHFFVTGWEHRARNSL